MRAGCVKQPTEEDKLNLARTESSEYKNIDSFSLDFKTKLFELVSGEGP